MKGKPWGARLCDESSGGRPLLFKFSQPLDHVYESFIMMGGACVIRKMYPCRQDQDIPAGIPMEPPEAAY